MKYMYLLLSFLMLCSCGQYRAYQKVLKSDDPEFKYSQAVNYYDNEDEGDDDDDYYYDDLDDDDDNDDDGDDHYF